jgi:iron complex outermembrane recepter protein
MFHPTISIEVTMQSRRLPGRHRHPGASLPVGIRTTGKGSLTILAGALLALTGQAYAAPSSPVDIADLDLDELANIRVTSVSKRPELLANAPAAIFVISGEDIRRSSATTLPEALRLAPNLQVARVDARNYAITARGFNNPFENKLLVLIDGRIVYSPLFSGVYWDAQDVVLEDVSRIEIISGPGSTLWGSNAVNGVINITTKSAADTQGPLASLGAGKDERNGSVRYGGTTASGAHYRVYGKYIENDDTHRANGTASPTGWNRRQTGFRTDWGSKAQGFTVQGDAYSASLHQAGTRNIEISGANLNGRSNTTLSDGSILSLQAYWDYTQRDQPGAFVERLNTVDLQAQHSLKFGDRHQVVWGGGYRVGFDRVENAAAFAFLPEKLNMRWGNVFVQDDISLSDTVRLTAGMKMEHNQYTGAEFLPTLRLAWNPTTDQLVWTSASRTVRSPSRIDRDFYSPAVPRVVAGVPQYAVAGGPDFDSEVANVLEIGYRAQPTKTISYSATAFHAHYDKLRTLEPNPFGPGSVFRNFGNGRTTGLEAWGNWQASEQWRLSAGFVTQRVDTSLDPGSRDSSGTTGLATSDPSNKWLLRSLWDLAAGQELDLTVRHVSQLSRPIVPSYKAVDLRYGWKVNRHLELSVIGQNLLDPKHPEWGSAPNRSEYERSVFVKAVWRM